MKGLAKAIFVFVAGSLAVIAMALGLKLLVVKAVGERAYRLPSLQLERLARRLPQKPVTDARVLLLGDSTATFSLDASRIRHAESFATVNTTTIETYYLLRRILDSGSNPNCILASYSFQWELNRGYFWNMFVASGFYSDAELAEIEAVRAAAGEAENSLLARAKLFAARRGWLDLVTLRRLQEVFFYWGWGKESLAASRMLLQHRRGSTVLPDASNFEGSLDMFFAGPPSLTRTEEEYLRRTLELARERGIPFVVLKIPFPDSVPAEKTRPYWEAFEEFFLRAGAPFRVIAPPPMPESQYISAGHLNAKGVQELTPKVERALEMCYR